MFKKSTIPALVVVASLAACGGGSDDGQGSSKAPVLGQNGAISVSSVALDDSATCSIANFASTMLAAVNTARAQARNCGSTPYAAAQALGWNSLLTIESNTQAVDMASNGAISDTNSAGDDLLTRVDATGYEYEAVGQNVAKGYTTIPKLMEGFLASEEHCKKIMSPSLTEMGAACVTAETGTSYWAQTFGVNKSFN